MLGFFCDRDAGNLEVRILNVEIFPRWRSENFTFCISSHGRASERLRDLERGVF